MNSHKNVILRKLCAVHISCFEFSTLRKRMCQRWQLKAIFQNVINFAFVNNTVCYGKVEKFQFYKYFMTVLMLTLHFYISVRPLLLFLLNNEV